MNTPHGALIVHAGARRIDRLALKDLPEPQQLGPRHQPVAHHRLVETLAAVLEDQHLHVKREEYAIYGDQAERIFGVLDVESSNGLGQWSRPGQGFALGLRGANDRTMSLQIAVGARVFVCDNMAFAGDLIALRRRHTIGLALESELRDAVLRFKEQTVSLVEQTDRAKTVELTPDRAKALMHDQFIRGTLPVNRLAAVSKWYFDPPTTGAEDVSEYPRTLWSLVNAFTREMRDLKPARKFTATARIGKLLAGV